MTPIYFILSNLMLFMGYILGNLIIVLQTPIGFGSIFFLVSFFDFTIAKSIIKDIKNRKHKIIIRKECVGEACNIPVFTTAS